MPTPPTAGACRPARRPRPAAPRQAGSWATARNAPAAVCVRCRPGCRRDMGCHGILCIVVGVKAVPRAREPPDDHLDVLACPPGHLVADKQGFFPQAVLPYRAAELAQLLP